MALGRISGPLLKSNLLRNGVDLAFETNLLYLDVTNRRVGINTSTPSNDLQVNGTVRATNLTASGTATLGTISFTSNSITSTSSQINLTVSGANPVVYQGILKVGNLQLTNNVISTTALDANIVFTTTGTGAVVVNSNLTVQGNLNTQGNLTVQGDITVQGNIQIGDQTTDTVSIVAGVTSNILPATTNTYNLGSSSLKWANVYASNLTLGTFTVNNFSTANLNFANGTITNTINNQDISFVTAGTGGINIGNFKINGNTITNTVSNAVSNITQQSNSITFNGTVASQNALTFTGSVVGNILTVSSAPSNGFGGSIQFSGSNYLTLSTPQSVGSQAYTVECFVYMTSFTSIRAIVGSTATGSGGFSLAINTLSIIQTDRAGYSNNQYTLATPMTLNAWHHIVATKNASGQETVFVDGVKTTSGYGTNVSYAGLTGHVGTYAAGNWNFVGSIGQLKMSIGTNYIDPTLSSITVPTAPLTFSTNTKLLLLATSAGAFLTDTSGTQTITNVGTVTFNATGPFSSAVSALAIGMVIGGGSLPANSYIVSNISGTGSASSSQWYINNYLTQTSITITATPTVLTVSSTPSGTIINGMQLTGSGLSTGTTITAFLGGTGGTGTYYITPTQTIITSTAITGFIQGYLNIGGTNGVVIPAGTTLQRPGLPLQGMIRFNSDPATLAVEIFNGTSWTGVAGIQSGITVAQATDIAAQWALTLG